MVRITVYYIGAEEWEVHTCAHTEWDVADGELKINNGNPVLRIPLAGNVRKYYVEVL